MRGLIKAAFVSSPSPQSSPIEGEEEKQIHLIPRCLRRGGSLSRNTTMIKFGIRQSFDKIEQIEDRYANIDIPVGLSMIDPGSGNNINVPLLKY